MSASADTVVMFRLAFEDQPAVLNRFNRLRFVLMYIFFALMTVPEARMWKDWKPFKNFPPYRLAKLERSNRLALSTCMSGRR